jgi:hypothetical protein
LAILFSVTFLLATTRGIALPSSGLTGQKTGPSLYDHEHSYEQLNYVEDQDTKGTVSQTDQTAKTYPAKYGNQDQSGTEGGGSRSVDTQKPEPQQQKVQPAKNVKNQKEMSSPLTYMNQGGKNIAVPGNMAGAPNWYVLRANNTNAANGNLPSGAGASMNSMSPTVPEGKAGLLTNGWAQAIMLTSAAESVQREKAPKNQVDQARASSQAQQQSASDAAADSAENAMDTSMIAFRQTLINVANEGAAVPTTAYAPIKLLSQAVWMVQQMYKHVYLPMALLLLLPGALLTNLKGVIAGGILRINNDEDAVSPFSGILRSLIAIFLIPATQLIVSWAIDIGNSMTFEVQKNLVPMEILQWAKQQTFNPPFKNASNQLSMPKTDNLESSQGIESAIASVAAPLTTVQGKIDGGAEEQSEVEQQSAATRMMQMAFNFMNMALGLGLTILLAFQVVLMCYLLLMGPIAAAFFAWPTSCGSLFKNIFVNWVDAVTNLALWRFWWCIVILCMQTRIEWLMELGEYLPNSTWEMAMYTAFMVILTYVPFLPFDYKPGEMVSKLLEKAAEAQQAAGGGGGGGGGGCGGGGGGGGCETPGGDTPADSTPGGSPSSEPGPGSNPGDDIPTPSSGNNEGSSGDRWTYSPSHSGDSIASHGAGSAPPLETGSPQSHGSDSPQIAMAPPPMHDPASQEHSQSQAAMPEPAMQC